MRLANRLLVELEMNIKVKEVKDISAAIFVQMLEQICDEKLECKISRIQFKLCLKG